MSFIDLSMLKRVAHESVRVDAVEERIEPHPMLSQGEVPHETRTLYLQGCVLAAMLNNGDIDAKSKAKLVRLGESLELELKDVNDCILSTARLGENDQGKEELVRKLIKDLSGDFYPRFFIGDFEDNLPKIGGELTAEMSEYLDAFGTSLCGSDWQTVIGFNTGCGDELYDKAVAIDEKTALKMIEAVDLRLAAIKSSGEIESAVRSLIRANQWDMAVSLAEGILSGAEPPYLQYQLGLIWYALLPQKDVTTAFSYFEKASDRGCKEANYMIGRIYEYGELGSRDYVVAKKYFDDAEGVLVNLAIGHIYEFGLDGGGDDVGAASEWYECCNIARAYPLYKRAQLAYLAEHPEKKNGVRPEWGDGPANEFRKDSWTICLPQGGGISFKYCAPGRFKMGDCAPHTNGAHCVTITKGFWLSENLITQGQWLSVMGSNPSICTEGQIPLALPVENVSWVDCQIFLNKLNERLGICARLPTEAEWEYACRAGTTTAFCWGNSLNGDNANCNGEIPYNSSKGVCVGRTTECGWCYPQNSWGFKDMHGNVNEWCQDWYGPLGADSVDPVGAATGTEKVIRGGAWRDPAKNCTSFYRDKFLPTGKSDRIGFRICVPLVDLIQGER